AAKQPGVRELLPEPTGRALWEMWTSMERVVEEEYMKAFGVDPETASEEERAQFNISLPEEMESWSKVWRGMSAANCAQRSRDIQIPYAAGAAARVMDILGMPVPPEGLAGEQFLNVIHQASSRDVVEHPALVRSSAEYGIFLNTRGQQVASAEEVLQTAVINRVFREEFRQAVAELLIIRDQNHEIRKVMLLGIF